jgi:2-methylisocitrate lyase-like PEP mutase family enzyme
VNDVRLPGQSALASAAEALLAAHRDPEPLLLANVWDVASARMVEEAGFAFIATSSHAIADVLGERDDDSSDPDLIFDFIARITRAVDRPVSADVQAGYRLDPTDLVGRLLRAGIVGCNLEDTDHHGSGVLVDAERQAAFLAQVRAAAETAGVHLVVNARVDTFVRRVGDEQEQLDEAIRRGRLYLAAGADCVYPIGLADRAAIGRLTEALPGPVNILARRGGPRFDELAMLGVRRISLGAGLHQLAGDHLRTVVRSLTAGASLDEVWPAGG